MSNKSPNLVTLVRKPPICQVKVNQVGRVRGHGLQGDRQARAVRCAEHFERKACSKHLAHKSKLARLSSSFQLWVHVEGYLKGQQEGCYNLRRASQHVKQSLNQEARQHKVFSVLLDFFNMVACLADMLALARHLDCKLLDGLVGMLTICGRKHQANYRVQHTYERC